MIIINNSITILGSDDSGLILKKIEMISDKVSKLTANSSNRVQKRLSDIYAELDIIEKLIKRNTIKIQT